MPIAEDVMLISGANAHYFGLLQDLVNSIKADDVAKRCRIGILDLGLEPEHVTWFRSRNVEVVAIDWQDWPIDWPGHRNLPRWFLGMYARPFFPRYFKGAKVYISIDADAWVQDGMVINYYARAAAAGKLGIAQELDRSYFTMYRRPKLFGWDQNFKAYRWSYGYKVADRLARNPICNAGVFALAHDAPHWELYANALSLALNRHHSVNPDLLWVKLADQTALNYVIFRDKAPTTFLPAYCNWFCGKSTPMLEPKRGLLVEPNEPHQPLGIVHMAGDRIQERHFDLDLVGGGTLRTKLTYSGLRESLAQHL